MEAAESPLDVLSRAAVMLQRNVLPPPSYDEARSLSQQQQQKQKTQRKCKVITSDIPVTSSATDLSYDQTSHTSGKWKREKKHQQKTTAVASTCDSSLNDYKSSLRYSGKCSNTENSSEPLDMSKRTVTKDRGEPPSYFQSILSSNYTRRQSNVPSVVFNSNDEASDASSSSTEDKEAMCDQVINEHFRRSLGQDYVNVFSASRKHENEVLVDSQTVVSKWPKDEKVEKKNSTRHVSPSPLSVDDHFAKALGDTWIRLQQQEKRQSNQNDSSRTVDED